MGPSTTREQIIRSIEQLPEHFTSRELLIVVAATVDQTDPRPAAALRQLVEATDSATPTETAHIEQHAVVDTDTPGLHSTPTEHFALDCLGDYVGALDGTLWRPDDPDVSPPKDAFAAAVLDDQRRELAGLTKREWRQLDADQKIVAIAAGAARWR
jgi:hypothetical protein